MEKKLLAILILSMSLLVSIMAAKSQMGMETNIDRPGMNYNNYPLSSADPQICATAQTIPTAMLLLISNQDLEGRIQIPNAG